MTGHPIFIHSMFRAGSTYLFNAFRRVEGSPFWCYQEPLHELFSSFGENPAAWVELTSKQNTLLRHPGLGKSYLAEYLPISMEIADKYRQTFPYTSYFENQQSSLEELRQYLAMLCKEAPARPVIQCCRTAARLPALHEIFPAIHVFLWRNPWDQWWSYKVLPYFDTANLIILSSPSAPPVIQELRRRIGIEPMPDCSIEETFTGFGEKLLDSADSYRVFYALWLIAQTRGFTHSDIQVSIDALSTTDRYRQDALTLFAEHGIHGLDFTDCHIHRGIFTKKDQEFFRPLEAEILALFESYQEDISPLSRLEVFDGQAELCDPFSPRGDLWVPICEDLSRTRGLFIQAESLRNQMQQNITSLRTENSRLLQQEERLTQVEAELKSIYQSALWRTFLPLINLYWRVRDAWRSFKNTKQNQSTPSC